MADIEQHTEPAAESAPNGTTEADDADETQKALNLVHKGSALAKVRSAGRRYQRFYYVDPTSTTLLYEGSRKCMKRPCQIAIKHIHEIREHEKRKTQFSIIIGEREKRLTLIAADIETKDKWVCALDHLSKKYTSHDPVEQQEKWLKECFESADKNRDGVLDKDEIISKLKLLNVSSEIAKDMKEQASKQKLEMKEFFLLYKKFSERPELDELFHKYASNGGSMNCSQLKEFFIKEQSQTLTEKELEDIIDRSEQCPQLKDKNLLSHVGFKLMFCLPELNVRELKCRKVYQDMTQPLNHYFINSSHNTYLEGHQLYGKSSSQQYSRVLTHRCRCVELDVWDGPDNDPVVYHGYTLTSKILFKDALEAIEKRAFKKSKYPVILSIENHCSVEQQVRMAEHLKDVFKDQLLTEPLPKDSTVLPSPEQLKGRVIVKGKKLPRDTVDGELLDESDEDEAADIDDEEIQERVKESKKKRGKLAQELSDCVIICQAMSFKGFEESRTKGTFVNMSSFSENKAEKLIDEDGGREYVRHNTYQLSRIYPAGTRTDSSNYDPVPMWMAGCQIVALNYQTRDDALMLNYGFFEDNGACGYVLKPEFMNSPSSSFSQEGPQSDDWTRMLTVRVISGYMLPKKLGDSKKNILDPYVRVEVHGVHADKQKFETHVIQNNGFNPRWNKEMSFKVTCPQLALLMFRVLDDMPAVKDATVAQYCLPMRCVQTGYRMIELRDMQGERLGPTGLFVHISIDKPLT